MRKMLTHQKT